MKVKCNKSTKISLLMSLSVMSLIGCSASTPAQKSITPNSKKIPEMVGFVPSNSIPIVTPGSSVTVPVYLSNETSSEVKSVSVDIIKSSNIDANGAKISLGSCAFGIKPKSTCELSFTTSVLPAADKGNTELHLSYLQDGKRYSTSGVLNYEQVSRAKKGIFIAPGETSVYVPKNSSGKLFTLYSYATTDTPSVKVSGSANVTLKNTINKLSKNEVGSLLLSVNASANIAKINLAAGLTNNAAHTAKKHSLQEAVVNLASVNLNVNSVGERVALGNEPYRFLNSESTNSTVPLINLGGIDLQGLTVDVTGSGSSNITATMSCPMLESSAKNVCDVALNYKMVDAPTTATLNIRNSANSVIASQTLLWYSNAAYPVIVSQADRSSIVTASGVDSPLVMYSFTNIGKAPYQDMGISMSTNIEKNMIDTCTGTTLKNGENCSVSFNVSKVVSANESGVVGLSINGLGLNSQSYKFFNNSVFYTIYKDGVLAISSLTPMADLPSDNSTIESQIVTVENLGSDDAFVQTYDLNYNGSSANTVKPFIEPVLTTCTNGSSLNSGQSCDLNLVYGPSDSLVGESGLLSLDVAYTLIGASLVQSSNKALYSLVSGASPVVSPAVPSGFTGGDGTDAGSATIMSPATVASGTFSITYTNSSATESMNSFSVLTGLLPFPYQVSPTSTCPTGATIGVLAPAASCDLVVSVDPAVFTLMGGMSSSFNYPPAVWTNASGTHTLDTTAKNVFTQSIVPSISVSVDNTTGTGSDAYSIVTFNPTDIASATGQIMTVVLEDKSQMFRANNGGTVTILAPHTSICSNDGSATNKITCLVTTGYENQDIKIKYQIANKQTGQSLSAPISISAESGIKLSSDRAIIEFDAN